MLKLEAATNIARILQGHYDLTLSDTLARTIDTMTGCGFSLTEAEYAQLRDAVGKPVCAWCHPGSKGNSIGSHGICPMHKAEMLAEASLIRQRPPQLAY